MQYIAQFSKDTPWRAYRSTWIKTRYHKPIEATLCEQLALVVCCWCLSRLWPRDRFSCVTLISGRQLRFRAGYTFRYVWVHSCQSVVIARTDHADERCQGDHVGIVSKRLNLLISVSSELNSILWIPTLSPSMQHVLGQFGDVSFYSCNNFLV